MTQLFISCKESRIENNRSFYGSFVLGPFEGGQSLTIANALRRTLLSELKGLAIVSIQIEGVLHEYSSIPGVKDSVLDILLNLKEIHFTSHFKKAMLPQIGYLRVRGPGVVRASDLKLPPFIKLVDPDQYIATLADDGFLNMKLIISEGKNYMLSSQKVAQGLPTSTNQALGARKSTSPNSKHLVDGTRGKGETYDFSFNLRRNLLQKMGLILDLENQKTSKIYNLKKHFLKLKKNSTNKLPENLPNSNPLMIDSVFAPVTKVNYMIEYSEHKTIDTSFSNAQEINQIFNFSQRPVTVLPPEKHAVPSEKTIDTTEKSNYSLNGILGDKTTGEEILNIKNQLSYVNIAKDSLKPSSIKQNVIIEIWTNGSMHPRDALNEGLKNMFKVFYNLYKIGCSSFQAEHFTHWPSQGVSSSDFTLSNTSTINPQEGFSDLKMSSLGLNSLKQKQKLINSSTLSKLNKLNRKKPIIANGNKNVIPINKSFFSSL